MLGKEAQTNMIAWLGYYVKIIIVDIIQDFREVDDPVHQVGWYYT